MAVTVREVSILYQPPTFSPEPFGDHLDYEQRDTLRTSTHFRKCPIPDIVNLGHVRYNEAERPLDRHTHLNCFEVCYHYAGRQRYAVGDQEYITKCGDLFLTFPNEEHGSGTAPEEKSSFFYLIFHCMPDTRNFMGLPEADSDWVRNVLWSCRNRVFNGNAEIRSILSQVLDIYFAGGPMQISRITALLTRFFFLLCQCILESSDAVQQRIPSDIADIVAYIEEHLYETISVEELAQRIHLSDSQFKRKFKRYIGFTPYDYIVRQKILCAEEMLRGTALAVTQISFDLGFSSSQHFSSVFKKYTGSTPIAFRRARSEKELCIDLSHA